LISGIRSRIVPRAPWKANAPTKTQLNRIMQTEVMQAEDIVTQKTQELCQAILDQPNLRSARQRISAFIADDRARGQYEALMTKGQALQQKQQQSQPLTGEEISDFEKQREALSRNPVARGFLEAQEELHHAQESIHSYVSKTIELGRLPTAEEMSEGESCGHGCGCH
jgi:cell fate (sporulation/competence/biofilm development) regulator YlbF (YheA/YmcA/DUF963 family)